MFDLASDSKLRACDLMALRVCDVMRGDQAHRAHGGSTTQNNVRSASSPTSRAKRSTVGSSTPVFSRRLPIPEQVQEGRSPIDTPVRANRRQVGDVHPELDRSAYGTHTMRRTKPTLIYRRTGNLRAVQLPLGHTKIESTVRYLGVEVDDALALAEQTEA